MNNTMIRITIELYGERLDGPYIVAVAQNFTEEEVDLLAAPIEVMGETVMQMITTLKEQKHNANSG